MSILIFIHTHIHILHIMCPNNISPQQSIAEVIVVGALRGNVFRCEVIDRAIWHNCHVA